MLPKQAIDEFKNIYFKEEGVMLSDSETVALANNMMNLFKMLVKQPQSSNKVQSGELTSNV